MKISESMTARSALPPTGPCPNCPNSVKWGDLVCQYCGHKLSDSDIEQIKQYIEEQKRIGIKKALILWPIIIAFFALFVYLVNNFL